MTHALVTIVAPLAPEKLADAERAIDALGNPASDAVRAALTSKGGTHFASLHAFRSASAAGARLLFEFSADGTQDAASARIVDAIGDDLKSIFMLASDWRDGTRIANYLKSHRVKTGNGLFGNPGLPFIGTPGFSVSRILKEQALGAVVSAHVKAQKGDMSALARVADVRQAVQAQFPDALTPAEATRPFEKATIPGLLVAGLGQVAALYLWPVAILAVLFALVAAPPGFWSFVFAAGAAFVVGAVLVIGAVYGLLRNAEAHDSQDRRAPTSRTNTQMFDRENHRAQNHMISITRRKPGILRWFTSRFVFWVVGFVTPRFFEPGYLSDISTIHFARWVTLPGTRDLVFLSNYGGSWESYLEDFITKAHAGLTGIWSNTIGFPRAENLFQKGATDGDRFKRFARHSMVPTRFWYAAYPDLTTDTIRGNAAIRAGLSGVMTEDEAIAWLALFGSAPRPAAKLASSDIQSLIFGGLGFLPFGTCLVCDALPDDRDEARRWLAALRDDIAFNDGRRLRRAAVLTLCLGAKGLARLGLAEDSVASFPYAFVEGMPARWRILGDAGASQVEDWRWGRKQPDVALLVYALTIEARHALVDKVKRACAAAGMAAPHEIPMRPVKEDKVEPFGFADGISQPVIRGTYKSLRNADSIHIVEPGEFILGYPDNRGYLPISPTMSATEDPGNVLPLVDATTGFQRALVDTDRDVGFNGTFLVMRELEQDVEKFDRYCETESERLKNRLPPPYAMSAEFIGAKLIGRWKDGSSLVRYPYESRTAHHARVAADNARQKARPGGLNLVTQAADSVMLRPQTNPLSGAAPVDAAKPPPAPTQAPSRQPPGPTATPRDAAAPPTAAVEALDGYSHTRPDNDFLFGAEDADAMRCPFGAHMRRANPRDSLDPGSADQVAISNKHRIIRIGRHYDPQPDQKPGLFFMGLCADIERQFEFLQQTWLRSPSFHRLNCEKDPVLGDGEAGNCGHTIPSPDGPIALAPMPQFVTTRGGGYFFLPGRRLIDFLLRT